MKKDIHIPKVKEIAVAVIEEEDDWAAYLLNLNIFPKFGRASCRERV